jgi:hypothetical protein
VQAANALLQLRDAASAAPAAAQETPAGDSIWEIPLENLTMHDEASMGGRGRQAGKKGKRRRFRKVSGFFPATVLDGSDSVTGGAPHSSPHSDPVVLEGAAAAPIQHLHQPGAVQVGGHGSQKP